VTSSVVLFERVAEYFAAGRNTCAQHCSELKEIGATAREDPCCFEPFYVSFDDSVGTLDYFFRLFPGRPETIIMSISRSATRPPIYLFR
jgi:hypothetical protein